MSWYPGASSYCSSRSKEPWFYGRLILQGIGWKFVKYSRFENLRWIWPSLVQIIKIMWLLDSRTIYCPTGTCNWLLRCWACDELQLYLWPQWEWVWAWIVHCACSSSCFPKLVGLRHRCVEFWYRNVFKYPNLSSVTYRLLATPSSKAHVSVFSVLR